MSSTELYRLGRKPTRIGAVSNAFVKYSGEHPASSFADQAAILCTADLQSNDLVGWRQTTVAEFWGILGEDDNGDSIYYDPAASDKHWDICVSATKAIKIMEQARSGVCRNTE